MRRFFAFALLLPILAGVDNYAQGTSQPVVLDHVVAVINGDVLLESDVNEEVHFAAMEPFESVGGSAGRLNAMQRLINRTLILQQMKDEQELHIDVSDADVDKSLTEVREHLPLCRRYDCATPEGWRSFLAANDLTNEEVVNHWKQRMTVLRFIDARFRTGIRISQQSVEEYYSKSVVPVFARQNETAPALSSVTGRIQEILLEKQVNVELQDWLRSLRDQGGVRILDPAYGAVGASTSASTNSKTGAED